MIFSSKMINLTIDMKNVTSMFEVQYGFYKKHKKALLNCFLSSHHPKTTSSPLLLRLSLTSLGYLLSLLRFLFLLLSFCPLRFPCGLLRLPLFWNETSWFLWLLLSPICLSIQVRYLSTLVYTLKLNISTVEVHFC